MAQGALLQFRGLLERYFQPRRIQVRRWSKGRSRNMLEVALQPRSTVLYTKISNLTQGFWGLGANQLEALYKEQVNWFVILLHNAPDRGFILSSELVRRSAAKWSVSELGEYKVHAPEIPATCRFSSFDAIPYLITHQ